MSLATNDPADVGTYAVALVVGLADYSGVATITKNFTVTVTCTVLTLSFTTPPVASTTVRIGIDSQPILLPFATTKFPNCV